MRGTQGLSKPDIIDINYLFRQDFAAANFDFSVTVWYSWSVELIWFLNSKEKEVNVYFLMCINPTINTRKCMVQNLYYRTYKL